MNYGFVKVAAAIPQVKVADCTYNAQQIKSLLVEADGQGVEVVVFPELCLTGATCGDLFLQSTLLQGARGALADVAGFTRNLSLVAIVGLPLRHRSALYNVAAVLHGGRVLGLVPTQPIAQPSRQFASMPDATLWHVRCNERDDSSPLIPLGNQLIFNTPSVSFAIETGNGWEPPMSATAAHSLAGADIVFNPTAYHDIIGHHAYVQRMMSAESARALCGYVSASCGYGESTTDMVHGGHGLIYENGRLLAEGERFAIRPQLIVSDIDVELLRNERMKSHAYQVAMAHVGSLTYNAIHIANKPKHTPLTRAICPTPFVPQGEQLDTHCREVFDIQVAGLCKRIEHTHSRTAVVGISGGLDSTLALLVCVKAFDRLGRSRKEIVGITMPGFGTTGRTYNNALHLMQSLGISIREISIKEACTQHFSDIGHDIHTHDVTYENGQARERTQILMDVANQLGGMVIGTGDLSELALGWATYNGDHMSMYGVNAGVPKTLIQSLVAWIARHHVDEASATTLRDIIDTPISPELIPADEQGNIKQKTEDLVGPYELHDFFLYHLVRHGFRPRKIFFLAQQAFDGKYTDEVIKKWLTTFCRRFFNQQFKRSCLPDGPKVGSVSLSPRGDWQMPSDACPTEWLRECE